MFYSLNPSQKGHTFLCYTVKIKSTFPELDFHIRVFIYFIKDKCLTMPLGIILYVNSYLRCLLLLLQTNKQISKHLNKSCSNIITKNNIFFNFKYPVHSTLVLVKYNFPNCLTTTSKGIKNVFKTYSEPHSLFSKLTLNHILQLS